MEKEQTLEIVVVYPAARDDFREARIDPNESLGQLKTRVLNAFGLTEGKGPDGNITTYVFYHHKQKLEDLSQTLGQIAGPAHALTLKLAQQIIYG